MNRVMLPVQECAYGPSDLQQPPAWLSNAIGPVDASERAQTESVEPDSDSEGACQGQCSDDAQPQISPVASVASAAQAQVTGG